MPGIVTIPGHSSRNSCPVHLLPGSDSSEPTWAHRRNPWGPREEFLFSSKICHLQKEILKLRVMSDFKKAGKWDWEEHVCCSLNQSAQRMQGGLGWVLKYYFKILPSDPDNSSPCWLWVSAVPPALEPAAGTGACWWTCHAFLWKQCWKPQSLGLQCCREHSLPAWQVCTWKKMALEQNLIFVSNYAFFKQTANTLPSGFKGVRNKAGAAHLDPDLDLHYSVKRRILKLLCAWEKQDLYLRSHLWNITKAWAAKLLPWATSLSCTNNGYWDFGDFFPLVLLMAQSCVASRGALCFQRAPAQICPSSQPCPGNIPWDLGRHPGLALPKCLHSTWSAPPSAAFMQTNNNTAVEETPHSKLYCKFLIKRSKLAKFISLWQGIRFFCTYKVAERVIQAGYGFQVTGGYFVRWLSDITAGVDGVCESSASQFYGFTPLWGGENLQLPVSRAKGVSQAWLLKGGIVWLWINLHFCNFLYLWKMDNTQILSFCEAERRVVTLNCQTYITGKK